MMSQNYEVFLRAVCMLPAASASEQLTYKSACELPANCLPNDSELFADYIVVKPISGTVSRIHMTQHMTAVFYANGSQ